MTHMVKLIFKAYKKNCNERYQSLSEDEKKKKGRTKGQKCLVPLTRSTLSLP